MNGSLNEVTGSGSRSFSPPKMKSILLLFFVLFCINLVVENDMADIIVDTKAQ